jgi:hypothetical protein
LAVRPTRPCGEVYSLNPSEHLPNDSLIDSIIFSPPKPEKDASIAFNSISHRFGKIPLAGKKQITGKAKRVAN